MMALFKIASFPTTICAGWFPNLIKYASFVNGLSFLTLHNSEKNLNSWIVISPASLPAMKFCTILGVSLILLPSTLYSTTAISSLFRSSFCLLNFFQEAFHFLLIIVSFDVCLILIDFFQDIFNLVLFQLVHNRLIFCVVTNRFRKYKVKVSQ